MKDLAPAARAGLLALGKQWADPAFRGHSLLSLPGQVPAEPGRSCAKDQPFPGAPGHWMEVPEVLVGWVVGTAWPWVPTGCTPTSLSMHGCQAGCSGAG